MRFEETHGQAVAAARVRLGNGISAAREVNGQEDDLGPAIIQDGILVVDLKPYQARAWRLTLTAPAQTLARPTTTPLPLPYDRDVVSADGQWTDGDADGQGATFPAEQFPSTLWWGSIPFALGPTTPTAANALTLAGQELALPAGRHRCLYLLACTTGPDTDAGFTLGAITTTLRLQHWNEPIGHWGWRAQGLEGTLIKTAPIGLNCTHRHLGRSLGKDRPAGNDAYQFANAFVYRLTVPDGTDRVRLPVFAGGLLLAATLVDNVNGETAPAQPITDRQEDFAMPDTARRVP
jgi:alpha-mannosidase